MSKDKIKAAEIIRCIIFLLIAACLFFVFTYLFRSTRANQRRALLSFKWEEKNVDDMVFLGSSAVYRFWDPLYAWNESGITSFDYSSAGMTAVSYIPALEEVEKTQDLKLLMVDARRFLSKKVEVSDIYDRIRGFTDSLDLGIDRAKAVHRFCEKYDRSISQELEYQLDLIYYHDNYHALINPTNWRFAGNSVARDLATHCNKGYIMSESWAVIPDPPSSDGIKSKELSPLADELFREFIEYCKKKDYPFFFIVMPYSYTEEDMAEYLRMAEICAEYGVDFLNLNYEIDKIGIDFSQDFFDDNHSNQLGAEKTTKYVLNYLISKYNLPDRRGDEHYATSWNEEYKIYKVRADKAKQNILQKINQAKK